MEYFSDWIQHQRDEHPTSDQPDTSLLTRPGLHHCDTCGQYFTSAAYLARHRVASCRGSFANLDHEEGDSFVNIQVEGEEEEEPLRIETGGTEEDFIISSNVEEEVMVVEEVMCEEEVMGEEEESLEVTEEYLMQIDTNNVVIEVVQQSGHHGQIVATIVQQP